MLFRFRTAVKITFPRHYLKIQNFQKRENRTFSALSDIHNKVLSTESSLSITSQHLFKRQQRLQAAKKGTKRQSRPNRESLVRPRLRSKSR
mgnify:CR=1 FL=1